MIEAIIRQIVGRCHVGQDYLSVLRYVKSRLRAGAWQAMPREDRREIIRRTIEEHRDNRDLYRRVMSGRLT